MHGEARDSLIANQRFSHFTQSAAAAAVGRNRTRVLVVAFSRVASVSGPSGGGVGSSDGGGAGGGEKGQWRGDTFAIISALTVMGCLWWSE